MTTQTAPSPDTHAHRQVLRYQKRPRIIHALLASSFLLLLFTGLTLFWEPLAPLAAGGYLRDLHRVGAVLFIAVPILYLVLDRHGAKELLWDSFRYDKDDLRWLLKSPQYFLGRAKGMPPQGRLNAGQKLHHAGVVVFSGTIVASGMILWFGKGSLTVNELVYATIVHDLSMLILTVLLVGHLYFTFVYDAISGMTKGYIPEDAARLEHSKWVDEMPKEAPWIVDEDETPSKKA
jgi:formate dehydrogenase subunit gamma